MNTRTIAVIALIIGVLALLFIVADSDARGSTYLHQGETYVFQTIAARQLADQGAKDIVRVRPCDRASSRQLKCTITGHKPFGGVQTDCHWVVTVTRKPTRKGWTTYSSGAQGRCVEAPGQ